MKKISNIEKKFINKIITIFSKRFEVILKNNEKTDYKIIFWKIHRLHWEKNRFIFDLKYNQKVISNNIVNIQLYQIAHLYSNNNIDKGLFKLWKKKGYEIICSLIAIGDKKENKRISLICRVPLLLRIGKTKVEPDITTGCISCVSGDSLNGKPLWWNSKVMNNFCKIIINKPLRIYKKIF
uniref:G10 transcription factor n=1 Tax=Lotharella vacuolata TaxID=74820 RepID=A0A0H5BHC8_9EUKA|nr:G10 transcription factor [Lotharella vacuolata]